MTRGGLGQVDRGLILWIREKRAMDWNDVTLEDLVDALKEVDWSIPPRPLGEFFGKFSVPRNDSKWEARFRCNVY